MKVIKINKSYRNGIKEHFLVLDDTFTDVCVEDAVSEWCENDPCGMSYGYSYDWTEETDAQIINKVVSEKLTYLKIEIKGLKDRESKMKKFLNSINVE